MSVLLLQITAGRGPAECAWVVARLVDTIMGDARPAAIEATLIQAEEGTRKGTLLSALLELSGKDCASFAAKYVGAVQWIGHSRFRSGHKRKNWFVGVQRIFMPETPVFSSRDVIIECMRASGPGGQHVNTTNSAIRAVHLPTGLVAVSRDERSQFANRKRALGRLSVLVSRRRQDQADAAKQRRWDAHNRLERGNPVRVYEGPEFRLVSGCRC